MIAVSVDPVRCQGYGNCVSADPETFDLDDSGLALVLTERHDNSRLASLREAAAVCPVEAILVEAGEE